MAQIISEVNNQDARNRLVDVKCLLEEIDDYLSAINTIVDQLDLFKPIVSLMDGIGERIDKMHQDMVIGNKSIYDILEDTKLRDKEVK
jgi:hypothetical protein